MNALTWSWRVARLWDIDVYLHWTFLLLLAWIGYTQWANSGTYVAALEAVGYVLAVFGCVLLHEFGHALTARRYGIGTRDVTLLPIGGVARLDRMPREPEQEFWVALAGPMVNVAIAAVVGVLLIFSGGLEGFMPQPFLSASWRAFFANLLAINLVLVVFNLIPAFPMDGGRILRAVLASRLTYARATRVAASIGQALAIGFGILGLFGVFGLSPLLMLIALFVFLGAEAESRQVQTESMVEGLQARDAMMTRFRSLAPDDTLETAMDELLAGSQQDFPVVAAGQVLGLLTRDRLIEGLRSESPPRAVADLITAVPRLVDSEEPLFEMLDLMRQSKCPALPVMSDGQMVGLITMENVGELIVLRSARWGLAGRSGADRLASRIEAA